jgi:hypothetical protein
VARVSALQGQQPRADDNGDRTLPEGASHLLAADDDVVSTYRGYVAVGGAVVVASGLPPSCYPEVGPGRDARYCPERVEAARFSAEAGDPSARAAQDGDSQPHGYFVGGCGHRVPLVGATWHVGPCDDCDPSTT